MQKVVFWALLCLSALSARGALLLSESFTYPDGPIVGATNSPWTNLSGVTTADVVSGRLQVNSTRTEDIQATPLNSPYSNNSGLTLYARFSATFTAFPSATGTYFAHFISSGTHRCRIWTSLANAPSGFFRLGVGNSSNADNQSGQVPANLVLNTTYNVVVRYVLATGVSTIWINPSDESDAGTTAIDSMTPASSTTTFAFRQSTGEGTVLIDNLTIGTTFQDGQPPRPETFPAFTAEPADQTVTEGGSVTFSASVVGAAPLTYQWLYNNNPIPNATTTLLSLTNLTTNRSGGYSLFVTNSFGGATSRSALLTVKRSIPFQPAALTLLDYNVKGNGATDWSTNALQVQAIGRQVMYLNPDIITFQEIPNNLTAQMTNFVKAFLPGYFLATNSGTDTFIRAVILSRYPITRSKSWLDGVDLDAFGYTNGNFTRDLFEAEIAVPHFSQPLHVFTAHLKAQGIGDDTEKRAAEAGAISNFFVNGFLTTNGNRPYILTGDMNESDTSALSIQTLLSSPTGLRLTNPLNPITGRSNTWSTSDANPGTRFDYIMPSGLLFSNINNSQVFRTDKLNPVPPSLFSNDCKVASDHLPVLMVFNNPYEGAFNVTAMDLLGQQLTLSWQSSTGRHYTVEASSDLAAWNPLVSGIIANSKNVTVTTNIVGAQQFFRVNRLQ